MSIVVEIPDDSVGLEEQQQACTCRPEYVIRKDGSRLDRHRIDPFCPLHGYHYRREIASAYCRAFNRRRFFGNFIIRLGKDASDATLSWVKGYVGGVVKKYFDANCIIKFVLHPDDENAHRHLHVGVASDVGYVTWASIANNKSLRGRKPRLDLEAAWIDGNRQGESWNWSAYVLRVDEAWRPKEKIVGRLRRCWRSRAEKGQRIKTPTFSGKDQWYGADDAILDEEKVDGDMIDVKQDDAAEEKTCDEAKVFCDILQQPNSVADGLGWCLIPALRWKAHLWLERRNNTISASSPRISPFVGGIQDGMVGERRVAVSRPHPQPRPPPASARSPPVTTAVIRAF
jgi:hypothetical protein